MKLPSSSLRLFVALALAIAPPAAGQRSHPFEIGAEIGTAVTGRAAGLSDTTSRETHFPIGGLRAGVFIDETQEIEVKVSATRATGDDEYTAYRAELGFLFHFYGGNRNDLFPALKRRSQAYLRPFAGIQRISPIGFNRNEEVIGAGIGAKIPFSRTLYWRSELIAAHVFRRFAFESWGFNSLGLLTGVSVVR